MRVASTIVTEGPGWVSAGRALDEHADELERAIHLAAVVSIARRYLVTREVVRTALENVRQRLEFWRGMWWRWLRGRGMTPLPRLGLGMGWRPEIAGLVADLAGLRLCEVIAESLTPGQLPPALVSLRERGVSVTAPTRRRLSYGRSWTRSPTLLPRPESRDLVPRRTRE
jgi:hypothetical protein